MFSSQLTSPDRDQFSTVRSIYQPDPPAAHRRNVSGGQVHLPLRRGEALGRLVARSKPEDSSNAGQHRRNAETEIKTEAWHHFRFRASVPTVLQSAKHARYRKPDLFGTEKEKRQRHSDTHSGHRDRVLHLTIDVDVAEAVYRIWLIGEKQHLSKKFIIQPNQNIFFPPAVASKRLTLLIIPQYLTSVFSLS